ncbi:MAG: hypothetical protein RLZZ450_4706 [Pseudomonadota bacterium]|jgi:endonuclease/exonuclease/phosphatase family metal-dependent hydrolase
MITVRFVVALLLALDTSCGGFATQDLADRTAGNDARDPSDPSAAAGGRVSRAGDLRVATWNLEWLNRRDDTGPVKRREVDYERLRRYADKLDADVIALQEVDGEEAAARLFDPARFQLFVAAQGDPQRTGFVVRRGLVVTRLPDYQALDVGQVRVGVDMEVEHAGRPLRLLSIHLKSACFDEPLTSDKRDCKKLNAQLPVLEAWIDDRGREGVAAIVLGDFNRRLFAQPDEPFWRELDDGEPALSDLWSPTEGRRSSCWGSSYPDFIDHIVLNKSATSLALPDSFVQQRYDESDLPNKRVLSDHCPLSIVLADSPVSSSAHAPSGATDKAREARIKGNIVAHQRKIYHAPECPDYARTQIDESKHERWFSTARQAEAAGFVRAGNCP